MKTQTFAFLLASIIHIPFPSIFVTASPAPAPAPESAAFRRPIHTIHHTFKHSNFPGGHGVRSREDSSTASATATTTIGSSTATASCTTILHLPPFFPPPFTAHGPILTTTTTVTVNVSVSVSVTATKSSPFSTSTTTLPSNTITNPDENNPTIPQIHTTTSLVPCKGCALQTQRLNFGHGPVVFYTSTQTQTETDTETETVTMAMVMGSGVADAGADVTSEAETGTERERGMETDTVTETVWGCLK